METKKTLNRKVMNPFTGGLYYNEKHRENPTEDAPNDLNPLYRPIDTQLSSMERLELMKSVGVECIQVDELEELIKKNRFIYCYDGFEPSGRMHIAQGLMKAHNVNKLIDSGCVFIFWVADWFAKLNDKMMGDLEKIRVVGQYFIEIWKAVGMKMSNVKFLWCSDFINARPSEYWMTVMDIACKNNLTRIKKCTAIMGREASDQLSVAQMFYPCMQCTDIFFMGVDICQLGMDQRKVNMLAREYAPNGKKPIILSSHMISGLLEDQEKMSKSNPDSAIFMEDSYADIKRKLKKAYCEEGKIEGNPVIELVKYFALEISGRFEVSRTPENGGNITYLTYEELCADFVDKKLHPMDVKMSLATHIDRLIEPVRQHFINDPHAKKILQLTQKYQKEYDEYRKKKAKQENKKPKQENEKAKQENEKAKQEKK